MAQEEENLPALQVRGSEGSAVAPMACEHWHLAGSARSLEHHISHRVVAMGRCCRVHRMELEELDFRKEGDHNLFDLLQ